MSGWFGPKANDNLESKITTEKGNREEVRNSFLENWTNSGADSGDGAHVEWEPKTVRCVIDKVFDEGPRKFELEESSKDSDAAPQDDVEFERIRLQKHLKWMRQKEDEYLKKKEIQRIVSEKKREEEIQLQKKRLQKEKEREEKIREWQEQKAREKEERRREEMMLKDLEKELKTSSQAMDKEKLLEEWVKLKNRQKQLEEEKKAQLLKKEEEHKAIRQTLADISYKQWKEKSRGRTMSLPKNGYQIFAAKPRPVVKEDWVTDFSGKEEGNALRSSASTTSELLTKRSSKTVNDIPKEVFPLEDLQKVQGSIPQNFVGRMRKEADAFSRNMDPSLEMWMTDGRYVGMRKSEESRHNTLSKNAIFNLKEPEKNISRSRTKSSISLRVDPLNESKGVLPSRCAHEVEQKVRGSRPDHRLMYSLPPGLQVLPTKKKPEVCPPSNLKTINNFRKNSPVPSKPVRPERESKSQNCATIGKSKSSQTTEESSETQKVLRRSRSHEKSAKTRAPSVSTRCSSLNTAKDLQAQSAACVTKNKTIKSGRRLKSKTRNVSKDGTEADKKISLTDFKSLKKTKTKPSLAFEDGAADSPYLVKSAKAKNKKQDGKGKHKDTSDAQEPNKKSGFSNKDIK